MNKAKSENSCRFCNKSFVKERTLLAHICTKKRRWNERDTPVARQALAIFCEFNKIFKPSKKQTTIEDFINSNFYTDIMKLSNHIYNLNCIKPMVFSQYLFSQSIPVQKWTKHETYQNYLDEYLYKNEHISDAIQRSLLEIDKWSKKMDRPITAFCVEASPFYVVDLIKNGRLSPWFIFISSEGTQLLENMNEEQLEIIHECIDPNKWKILLIKNQNDVEDLRAVLQDAGL